MSAIGTMNHLAFDVPAERFDEYRSKPWWNERIVGALK